MNFEKPTKSQVTYAHFSCYVGNDTKCAFIQFRRWCRKNKQNPQTIGELKKTLIDIIVSCIVDNK